MEQSASNEPKITAAAFRALAFDGVPYAELLQAPSGELEAGSTAWHSALSLIHLAYRLERLAGDQHGARQWLRGPNVGLGRPPIERLVEPGGASALLDYTHTFYR